jgi:predicted component of type VI protein secretion system
MAWLDYNEALQELPDDTELVVGSGAQATWRVRNADLMPRHFVIAATPTGARIRPHSSDAVVAINGRQVSTEGADLKDGDILFAGSAQMNFWSKTPQKRDAVELEVLAGHLVEAAGRSAHSVARHSTGIGRDESNALVLDEATASRFHAEIRHEAGGHALRVMGTAGTKLNGNAITAPVLLNEGDEIQIAGRILRYTRAALPAGVKVVAPSVVESDRDAVSTSRRSMEPTPLGLHAVPGLATVARNSMRYVAVVSSLLAAAAIATLVWMRHAV